jgi:hypothetical protein
MLAMFSWTDAPGFFLLSAPGFDQTPTAALDADARKAGEIPHSP